MALNKAGLVSDLKAIYKELRSETNFDVAEQKAAEKTANAFEKYLKSGILTITGTSPAVGGFTGTGTIN